MTLVSYFVGGIRSKKPVLDMEPARIVNAITANVTLKGRTDALRAATGEEADALKKALPYTIWAGTFGERNDKSLLVPSGMLVLDFDKVSKSEILEERLAAAAAMRDRIACDAHTFIAFVSPRGAGVKVVVRHNFAPYQDATGRWKHTEIFGQILKYFVDTYDLSAYADASGSDISRACLLPFDPDAYYNPEAKIFEYKPSAPKAPAVKKNAEPDAWARTMQEMARRRMYFAPGNRNNFVHAAAQDQKRLGVSQEQAAAAICEMAESMGAGEKLDEYRQTVREVYAREPEEFGSRAHVAVAVAPKEKRAPKSDFRPEDVNFDDIPEEYAKIWDAFKTGQAGLAGLFAAAYCNEFLYDYIASGDRGWMQYVAGVWKHATAPSARQALAAFVQEQGEAFVRYMKHSNTEIPPVLRYRVCEYVEDEIRRSYTHKWRNETLREAALTAEMSVNTGVDFDADPKLLNLQNGVLNLETGELMPHDPSQRFLRQCAAPWEPGAEAPTFSRTLDYLFGEDEAGRQDMQAFQQYAGLCLSGAAHVQAFYYIYGDGGAGKSTLARALEIALGSYAVVGDTMALTTDRAGADARRATEVRLPYARLASFSEVPRGKALDEAYVKRMTGGDTMTARRLYSEAFEFMPAFNMIIVGNDKLRIQGQNSGVWRRVKFLRILNAIPKPARIDQAVIDARLRAEAAGILQWMFEGWQAYQFRIKNGLGLYVSPRIQAETEEYQHDNDILHDYWIDRLTAEAGARVSLMDVWRDYCSYCDAKAEDRGFKSSRIFAQALEERGRRAERDNRNQKILRGWRLATLEEMTIREAAEARGDDLLPPISDFKPATQDDLPF